MQPRRVRSLIGTFLFLITLGSPTGDLRADDASMAADPDAPRAATVLSLEGTVQVESDGQWHALDPGALVGPGDRIRTSDGASLHLVLADGSSIALGPNTEVRLDEMGSGAEASTTLISLAQGLLNAMVEHLKSGSRFEIRSPGAVAAVKGTDFEVSESQAGTDTSVTVQEGTVQLGDKKGGQFSPVRAMERRTCTQGHVGPDERLSAPEAEAFRQRWARAHELHARRFELLRQIRLDHRDEHARFLKALKDRGEARRAREDVRREARRSELMRKRAKRIGAVRDDAPKAKL